MLRLVGTVGSEAVSHDLTGDEVRIGREVDNDLVLADPSVSRHHAAVRLEDGAWFAYDRGSTNGVLLNGKPIERAAVRSGDMVRVGGVDLAVEASEAGAGLPEEGAGEEFPGATFVRSVAEFEDQYGLTESVPVAAGSATDKREELDAAYSNRVFGFLMRLAGQLQTAPAVDDVLERVMELAFEALPVDRGFILLLDEGGEPVCELARLGEETTLRPSGDIPISRTILDRVVRRRVALVTADAQTDERLSLHQSVLLHKIRSAMCAPLWSGDSVIGVLQVDSASRIGAFTERDLDLLTAVANYAAVAVERLRSAEAVERERRHRARLERYHSPQVIETVLGEQAELARGMRRLQPAEATVLYADLCGFTSYAETRRPSEVASYLEGFFSIAVEAVFSAGGTLDKFIGDCVMAFFGAPMPQEDHAIRAVEAAVAIQTALAEERRSETDSPRSARIGINTGPLVVGEIGTARRADYTVLGNSVNVARRLQETVAAPDEIALGASTAHRIAGAFATEPAGVCELKGLSAPVEAFAS